MVGSGTWSLGGFWANCDFDWDVMPWPVNPNTGKTAIGFGSAGLAVSAATEHPLEASNLCAFHAIVIRRPGPLPVPEALRKRLSSLYKNRRF